MFNNSNMTDFEKYAVGHRGINHLALNDFLNKSYNKTPMIQATMTPYIMEERQLNVAQVDVFSRLMMERIIWLFGPVEDFNTTVIQAQLMYLESVDSKKDISIHIDSPGGSVVAGLKLLDIMDFVKCDISTVNTGMAASMGSVLLGAGKKGKRRTLRHSKTMIHQSSGGAVGNIQDARIMMEEWEGYNAELFRLLGEFCGKTPEQVITDAERDKWLNADQALAYGIVDEIITTNKGAKK